MGTATPRYHYFAQSVKGISAFYCARFCASASTESRAVKRRKEILHGSLQSWLALVSQRMQRPWEALRHTLRSSSGLPSSVVLPSGNRSKSARTPMTASSGPSALCWRSPAPRARSPCATRARSPGRAGERRGADLFRSSFFFLLPPPCSSFFLFLLSAPPFRQFYNLGRSLTAR